MNLIKPYFITLTRADEGPLAGTFYDVNPYFIVLKVPGKDGGSTIIINALVFYGDAAPDHRIANLEMHVRETPAEIEQMIDAVHQRATEQFLEFQTSLSKIMKVQTEMLERENAEETPA